MLSDCLVCLHCWQRGILNHIEKGKDYVAYILKIGHFSNLLGGCQDNSTVDKNKTFLL